MNVKRIRMAVLRHVLILNLGITALVVQAIAWQVIDMDVMVCNLSSEYYIMWGWILVKEQWVT